MPHTYRPYDLDYDTPFVSCKEAMKGYFDKKFDNITIDDKKIECVIRHSVRESMCDMNYQFCGVHKHIDDAKHEIIHDCHRGPCGEGAECTSTPCECITKDDVREVVREVIDYKFDEVNFPEEFINLNEEIRWLQRMQQGHGCCHHNNG